MMQDFGTYETAQARRYLAQLAKHFAHKIAVTHDDDEAVFDFAFGPARLAATDGQLTATVTAAGTDALDRARQVIDDHLRRFAFREDFTQMTWAGPQAA